MGGKEQHTGVPRDRRQACRVWLSDSCSRITGMGRDPEMPLRRFPSLSLCAFVSGAKTSLAFVIVSTETTLHKSQAILHSNYTCTLNT